MRILDLKPNACDNLRCYPCAGSDIRSQLPGLDEVYSSDCPTTLLAS